MKLILLKGTTAQWISGTLKCMEPWGTLLKYHYDTFYFIQYQLDIFFEKRPPRTIKYHEVPDLRCAGLHR